MSTFKNWKEWEEAAGLQKATTFDKKEPAEHRRLASLGGQARHAKGTGHEWREGSESAKKAQRASAAARVRNRAAARVQRENVSPAGDLAARTEK